MIAVIFARSRESAASAQRVPALLGEPLRAHVLAVVRELDAVAETHGPGGSDVATFAVDDDTWVSRKAVERLRSASKAGAVALVADGSDVDGAGADVCALWIPGRGDSGARARELCDAGVPMREVAQAVGASTLGEVFDREDRARRIGTLVDEAEIERSILYHRACQFLREGVRIRDPRTVFIRGRLSCGPGVEIDSDVIIEGTVTLGAGVEVGAHVILANAKIGDGSAIKPYSFIEDSHIGRASTIGPYGRIRPGSSIGDSVQIGNFVEVKASRVGAGTRINHLAFVGDAVLGTSVTIGAGTITCNHNWSGMALTQIGDGAYVGSGCLLVAPVTIGASATIGAGSTITEDVPAGTLALARSRQVALPHWERPGGSGGDERR